MSHHYTIAIALAAALILTGCENTVTEVTETPVSESSMWHLEDYLLCSHTIKAGRVVIHEHLRNVHHRGER